MHMWASQEAYKPNSCDNENTNSTRIMKMLDLSTSENTIKKKTAEKLH